MLAIADHAHDDGGGAYPSIATLARKARTTPRNVKLLLPKLEAAGELDIRRGAGPKRTNLYRVKNIPHPAKGSTDGSIDGLGERSPTTSTHEISPSRSDPSPYDLSEYLRRKARSEPR